MTKQELIALLEKSDKAVARAVFRLNERQTLSEQSAAATLEHNGQGFKSCHAHIGTSMAKFYERAGFLTPKQVLYWRKLNKSGQMRIACYWKQLLEIAEENKKPAQETN
jgi:hypothetical protein